jgi:hypothetical protein
VINEHEMAWKEVVVVYFKAVFQYFPGGTEETHEEPQSG